MKRLVTLIFLFSILSVPAVAAASEIAISVRGMVCSFCGQGIKKKFSSLPGVTDVKVDMDAHLVKVTVQDGQNLTDDKIEEILKEAGYNIDSIKRSP